MWNQRKKKAIEIKQWIKFKRRPKKMGYSDKGNTAVQHYHHHHHHQLASPFQQNTEQ